MLNPRRCSDSVISLLSVEKEKGEASTELEVAYETMREAGRVVAEV